ncbi:hypothetical protein NA57DRAFT_61549 [Rhizodiscina lignyota]|uniref:DUF6594 domain-containing protein n=1 Tax=Rhizodiscina lignyota TaxID=1504668 RepID=A0A9P4I661_9PEZI|nr:hypothetical protein NA57DRAFT_61549 [Rhizodiscina lignyota]
MMESRNEITRPRGEPEISAHISTDPALHIFRRFRYLHIRYILRIQKELSELENVLAGLDDEVDGKGNKEKIDDREKHWQAVVSKLKEYDAAIQNHREVFNYEGASLENIETLYRFYKDKYESLEQSQGLFRDDIDLCAIQIDHPDHASLQALVTRFAKLTAEYTLLRWMFVEEKSNDP